MKRVLTKAEVKRNVERGAIFGGVAGAHAPRTARRIFRFQIRGVDQAMLSFDAVRYDYDATLLTLYLREPEGGVELIPWTNVAECFFVALMLVEGGATPTREEDNES